MPSTLIEKNKDISKIKSKVTRDYKIRSYKENEYIIRLYY
jgi:hypothetical protein